MGVDVKTDILLALALLASSSLFLAANTEDDVSLGLQEGAHIGAELPKVFRVQEGRGNMKSRLGAS